MKATSVKKYQTKFQTDMSLYMETAWIERKAQFCVVFFRVGGGFDAKYEYQ
jgi:hypothetical protein